ncbi:MAG: hypothetical protein WA192_00905 [Candidatus Acidiferrales bacterium]
MLRPKVAIDEDFFVDKEGVEVGSDFRTVAIDSAWPAMAAGMRGSGGAARGMRDWGAGGRFGRD